MAQLAFQATEPFHPPFTPDPAWERLGLTPHGHQLFRETTTRGRAVPDTVDGKPLKEDGSNRRHRRNPLTGDTTYPLNREEVFEMKRVFYLLSEGNGNHTKIDWSEANEADLAADARAKKVANMVPEIAAAFVDSGVTPEALAAALRMVGDQAAKEIKEDLEELPVPEGAKPPPATAQAQAPSNDKNPGSIKYPYNYAPGRWLLSDETKMQGKKTEAQAAEAALHREPTV